MKLRINSAPAVILWVLRPYRPLLAGIDTNVFVGLHLWTPFGARGVYGGQVAAQALCASCFTVEAGFTPNSQHCLFLRSADGDRPVVYTVHRIRTGRSFATRWCVASQAAKPVFACSVSFHTEGAETSPLEHQSSPPSMQGADIAGRHTTAPDLGSASQAKADHRGRRR